MKLLAVLALWTGLGVLPTLASPLDDPDGTFCIDNTAENPDCEVVYTGSGTVSIQICIKNKGCPPPAPVPQPNMTVTFTCTDGAPANLTIGFGETKCGTCKIKKVTVCDTHDCEPCGDYWITFPPV